MSELRVWYLEREIENLKEEVSYWKYNYNRAMNFFLRATALRTEAEAKLSRLKSQVRKTKKRRVK